MSQITINEKQRLFVIKIEGGYTCLGFDVCEKRTMALRAELKRVTYQRYDDDPLPPNGSIESYNRYEELIEIAHKYNKSTGYRFMYELTPQLIGLEGKAVEVEQFDGEKRKFIIGRSMGFIPVHIEIEKSSDHGGSAVYGAPFKSVKVITKKELANKVA
jgi:hypothetical protein